MSLVNGDSIEKVIAQGINAENVQKLQDAGIHTCNGLMIYAEKKPTGIEGLSEANFNKICDAAAELVKRITQFEAKFHNVEELLEELSVSFGIKGCLLWIDEAETTKASSASAFPFATQKLAYATISFAKSTGVEDEDLVDEVMFKEEKEEREEEIKKKEVDEAVLSLVNPSSLKLMIAIARVKEMTDGDLESLLQETTKELKSRLG